MKSLVVFSGAGVSAESGIATFRGSDGLWENHRIEDVATPEAWRRDPDLVTRFYNLRRKNVMEAKPNAAHTAIARLEERYKVTVVTQNIDDLHERGGSSNVLHLHGEIMQIRSESRPITVQTLDRWEVTANDRCSQGLRMRPNIVWFGEAVPMLEQAAVVMAQADVLIIVGTSLVVYPAASLIHYIPDHCEVYVIDPQLDQLPGGMKATVLKTGAVEGFSILLDRLM